MFHHIHTPFATFASKLSAQDWFILQMNQPDCTGHVAVKGHQQLQVLTFLCLTAHKF